MKTILQVPIEKKLRDEAVATAEKQGFSSLQDVVRLFLAQFVDNKVAVSFTEPPVQLSKRAAKRYDKIVDEFLQGKAETKSFSSVDELMAGPASPATASSK